MTGEEKVYALAVLWSAFGLAECSRRRKLARHRPRWKLARKHH